MIDPVLIREDPDRIKQNILERNLDPQIVDDWMTLDTKRSEAQRVLEEIHREQNALAEKGKRGTDVDALRPQGKALKDKEHQLQDQFVTINREWTERLMLIPNLHFADVPKGKNEKENVEVRKVGTLTKSDFIPLDHLTLATNLGLLDFEAGAKVAGSQFYYTKGDLVLLEYALMQFGMKYLQEKGFSLVATPDLAKSRFYLGTGYAPVGDEAQTYEINGEDLGLIATAEVTIAGMHADEILTETQLPKKYVAISHCFRREAGAYGKYSKGLYRVHQFTKLEMFIYATPEISEAMHKEILQMEEELTQALGIPYRVVEMCTGDLGAMAARKYDLEAWMPGRSEYGEITSCSNCTDYQARNLNIKYRDNTGKTKFVHMLNGTAFTSSRHPLAILENYQQADGTVKVPDVLQPYIGKDIIAKV